jgi:hypothetical protein
MATTPPHWHPIRSECPCPDKKLLPNLLPNGLTPHPQKVNIYTVIVVITSIQDSSVLSE